MATVDELTRALRNADRAGDTGAAKRFADEIRKMRGAESQGPSTAMDVLKSGASGLARGAADVVGLPGTIGDALDAGGTWALRKGYEAVTGQEPSPEGGAMERFFAGPTQEMQDKLRFNGGKAIVSGDTVRGALSDATGGATDYQPQTRAGKYARTVGEFLPGAVVGGGTSLGNLVRFGLAPALTSETAGQATEGTSLEPWARLGGAIVGPAIPSLAKRAISPMPISPERQKLVDMLTGEGVDLTAGQKTGRNSLRYAESELGGGKYAGMMEKQGEQFTAAALKKAGIAADRASPEVIDDAFTRIGGQFDNLAARNTLVPDQQMIGDLGTVAREYGSMVPQSARAPIVEDMLNDITNAIKTKGALSGEAYQAVTSRLARAARGTRDPELSSALRGIRESLDDAMERSIGATNPGDMGAWREARNQYRNMLVLEKAATGAGENAAAGIISPSQLRSATVQQGRRAYARGQGDFAELARAGEGIMKPMPQSGTAPRQAARNLGTGALSILGGGAGAMHSPEAAIAGMLIGGGVPAGAGRALLFKPVRAYLGNQLTKAEPLADKRYAAPLAAVLRQLLLGSQGASAGQ